MSIHFQAVTEKLTPHDAILSFTSSAELNDNTLLASCSLNTAPVSIKSSNDSLRQPGLAGITDDACENQVTTTSNQKLNKAMDSSRLGQSIPNRDDQRNHTSNDKENRRPSSSKHSASPASSSRTASNVDKALPPTPGESKEPEKPKTAVSYDDYELRPSYDGRPSSQSLRPSTRDLHSAHCYKQKVKLGPRPSTGTQGRPTTADPPSRAADIRPISTLPVGLRMPVRKAVPTTPKSQQSQIDQRTMVNSAISSTQPVPSLPTKTPPNKMQSVERTKGPTSGVKGELSVPVQTPAHKSPTMTPEKRRLMKALQLRQKQMAARSLQETHENAPVPDAPDDQRSSNAMHEDPIMKSSVDIFSVDKESNIVHVGMKVFDKETPAHSETSPTSVTEPSDGPSTQASSISDEEEAAVQQDKSANVTKVLEPQGDAKQMSKNCRETSAKSHDIDLMPQALSIQQGDKTLNEEQSIELLLQDHRSLPSQVPSTEEDNSATTEPDLVCDSALPTEPLPKIVPSLPKPASDAIPSPEVPLPAISEDEDPPLNALGLSYGDANALLPFLRQDSAPQGSHLQITSHPRDEDEPWTNTRPSTADTVPDNRYRRHGPTRSVKRVSETSDDNFLSDDSFMEELKYAVVQEAKPISVSKSPITPVFPRTGSDQGSENGRTARSVSNPLKRTSREDLLSPDQQMPFPTRSFSIPESQHFGAKPTQILLPTKVGVSSGISQRIKALEKLSSRPPSPSGAQLPSPAISPPFVNLRKASLRNTPPVSDPASHGGHTNRQPAAYPSPSPSPEANLAKNQNALAHRETSSRPRKSRPESISVTARIIRGGRNQVPEVPLNPSEPCAVDLYQSPLTVDHQPKEDAPKPTLSPLKPPTRRWASNLSISSSSTEHQNESAKASRRDSFMSRRSTSSRRGSDIDLPRSISETSLATLTADGKKEDKKDSRKSRLFKRMSNISSASRRSIVQALSPTVKEDAIAEHHEPVYETPPAMVDVGDINVQFPDTLVGNHLIIVY